MHSVLLPLVGTGGQEWALSLFERIAFMKFPETARRLPLFLVFPVTSLSISSCTSIGLDGFCFLMAIGFGRSLSNGIAFSSSFMMSSPWFIASGLFCFRSSSEFFPLGGVEVSSKSKKTHDLWNALDSKNIWPDKNLLKCAFWAAAYCYVAGVVLLCSGRCVIILFAFKILWIHYIFCATSKVVASR